MVQPVKPKYVCWKCSTSYDADMRFCGKCGADMHRASRLQREAELSDPVGQYNPEDDDPWLGKIIDNRYRIIEALGHGGMGVVYKVEHQRMGKVAALKLLHTDLARDPEVQARFRVEAEAVSRLTHHNTVQVFDFGAARGVLYLVMEFVNGIDIGELVDRDGPQRFEAAAPIFAQTCASLIEAHSNGVIHRDLKPENIVVSRTHGGRDFVKVLDFGLAKLSEREEVSGVTARGTVVGTPYYMSPEQIRGEDIDARSDIYAVGALMYKVLTGDPPFVANSPVGVLTKHLTDPLVPPSEARPDLEIDERVDELIERCLEKDPADRYQEVSHLADAIEELYTALDSTAQASRQLYVGSAATAIPRKRTKRSHDRPGTVAPSASFVDDDLRLRRSDIDLYERRLRRRRTFRAFAVPLVLLGLAAGGYYYWRWQRVQPRTAELEPNDEPETATRISAGRPVTGQIGARRSDSRGDRDVFILADPIPTDGSATVTVKLTAQRNIDMVIELIDSSGTRLAIANANGVGEDEWIRRHRVTSPTHVAVAEVRSEGLPTESISEHYTIEVTISPVTPELETEPNDLVSDANRITPGHAITAHFTSQSDLDLFRFEGPDGEYQISLAGAQTASLAIESKPLDLSKPVTLKSGQLIEAKAGDRHAPWDAPYTVEISRGQ